MHRVAAAQEARIHVGAAKVDVTPSRPVVLAGYGGRTGELEGIDTRLWARALVIGNDNPVAIVAVDNCGVPGHLTDALGRRLNQAGIAAERLIVAATHTHNAPSLPGYASVVWAGRTTAEENRHVEEYAAFLLDQMEAAILAAVHAREPMHLQWAQGRVTFGGNRRVLNKGAWAGFGFQRSGPVDHSLPVLAARDLQGQVRAVWANYACHCTTVGSRNRVGGDWAGFANASIEQAFPQAVSLMTIGCGADIGPQPSGSLELAARHGQSVANEVRRLLASSAQPLSREPDVAARRIKLPLATVHPRDHWEQQLEAGGFHAQLAKAMLARLDDSGSIPAEVDYPLSVWRFGDELAMVFLAGEVVVDYSVRLNRELDWSRLWITAWANEMPGYIPSRRILAEGGYEADFSQVYYAQPARYAPAVEDVLVGAIKELAGDGFAAEADQEPAPFHQLPSGQADTFRKLAARAASPLTRAEADMFDKARRYAMAAKSGIDRVTQNDGEQTEWYDFAGDFTTRLFIRQQSKGTELRWQTPLLERSTDQPLILCFSGGVGWTSQPQTAGFSLFVADEPMTIEFDVTREASVWKSEDERIELFYLPTWTSDVDSAGFFFLRLAAEGEGPIEMGVRSLGEGSLRWFAIDQRQGFPGRLEKLVDALTDPK